MGIDEAQIDAPGCYPSAPGMINIIQFATPNLSDGRGDNEHYGGKSQRQDLDARSKYSRELIATGTGADGVTIVSSDGIGIGSRSNHLTIGQLIGKDCEGGDHRGLREATWTADTQLLPKFAGITRVRPR